jgi:hypothetical protein
VGRRRVPKSAATRVHIRLQRRRGPRRQVRGGQ